MLYFALYCKCIKVVTSGSEHDNHSFVQQRHNFSRTGDASMFLFLCCKSFIFPAFFVLLINQEGPSHGPPDPKLYETRDALDKVWLALISWQISDTQEILRAYKTFTINHPTLFMNGVLLFFLSRRGYFVLSLNVSLFLGHLTQCW